MTDSQCCATLSNMLISTPWGDAPVIVGRGSDQRWYAVLRDPPPVGLLGVFGVIGSTAAAALDALTQQCHGAVRTQDRCA